MRAIEIDLEIHKLIESARRSFDEPEVVILRRLLELEDQSEADERAQIVSGPGLPWRGRNRKTGNVVELPHGERIYAIYNDFRVEGEIVDGKIRVKENFYESLSRAAIDNVRTKDGSSTPLNGWKVWHRKKGNILYKMIDSD